MIETETEELTSQPPPPANDQAPQSLADEFFNSPAQEATVTTISAEETSPPITQDEILLRLDGALGTEMPMSLRELEALINDCYDFKLLNPQDEGSELNKKLESLLETFSKRQAEQQQLVLDATVALNPPEEEVVALLETKVADVDNIHQEDGLLTFDAIDPNGNKRTLKISQPTAIIVILMMDLLLNNSRGITSLLEEQLEERVIGPLLDAAGLDSKKYLTQFRIYKDMFDVTPEAELNALLLQRNSREIYEMVRQLDDKEREKMLAGQQFGKKFSRLDYRTLTHVKEQLSRLSGWQKKELKLAE